MKNIFAVETAEEFEKYNTFVRHIQGRLDEYIDFLRREYAVCTLPKSILWTSGDIATRQLSNILIPAYTNEHRIVMCPELDTWRAIYLRQLEAYPACDTAMIRDYYDNIPENQVLQILGHELAHHSELFLDADPDEGIWFEEGMVEYISRRYFLSDEEFDAQAKVNEQLVRLFKFKNGHHSLEAFGAASYRGDDASIFYEYWRSFLAVRQIINDYGDIQAVFASYHKWAEKADRPCLADWFGVNI